MTRRAGAGEGGRCVASRAHGPLRRRMRAVLRGAHPQDARLAPSQWMSMVVTLNAGSEMLKDEPVTACVPAATGLTGPWPLVDAVLMR